MSILIKGISMPKACLACDFCNPFAEEPYCRRLMKVTPKTTTIPDCPLMGLPTIEELMEPMCDQCQWPGWYKDPDDMQREKCSRCPVEAKLAEALYDAD